jgi:hypothetical protein
MVKMTYIDSTRTLTEKDSIPSNSESAQSNVDWRQVRWQHQREVRALLPHERVAFCMRRIQATAVDVSILHRNKLLIMVDSWFAGRSGSVHSVRQKFPSSVGLR